MRRRCLGRHDRTSTRRARGPRRARSVAQDLARAEVRNARRRNLLHRGLNRPRSPALGRGRGACATLAVELADAPAGCPATPAARPERLPRKRPALRRCRHARRRRGGRAPQPAALAAAEGSFLVERGDDTRVPAAGRPIVCCFSHCPRCRRPVGQTTAAPHTVQAAKGVLIQRTDATECQDGGAGRPGCRAKAQPVTALAPAPP